MSAAMLNEEEQLRQVSRAFTNQSPVFDSIEENNRILMNMRERIRRHVLSIIPGNSSILELNAGTGMDALYFAERGHHVTATDNAEGMVQTMKAKFEHHHLRERLKVQKCSYTRLSEIKNGPFDLIFSNFGGLNCTPDPGKVIASFPALLKPGGMVCLVVMPAVCPWELMLALKGNFKTAFRRLKKNGVMAHVEGVHFRTWYFSPGRLIKDFGSDFSVRDLSGLCSVAPPPYLENIPERFPKLFSMLSRLDEKLEHRWPFNSCADHFMLTMENRRPPARRGGKTEDRRPKREFS
jgi:ubiquinone/menaquinone biosynthesis C-methylase UbiE